MRAVLLLALVVSPVFAQEKNQPDWKLIKEMSGEAAGIRIETYAAQIARNGDILKVSMDFRFADGLPTNICDDGQCIIPRSVNASEIRGFTARIKLDCSTLTIIPERSSGDLYVSSGKHYPTKEPPFRIEGNNIVPKYFCEQPSATPTTAPELKPAPSPRPDR